MSDKPKVTAPNMWGMIPGGHPISKILWVFILLSAFIYISRSGLIRVGIIATRDSVAIVGPDFRAASAEVGSYTPGAPRVQVVIGDRTYNLFGGKEPGSQYVALFGAGSTSATSGFTTATGRPGDTTAATVSQLAQGVQTGGLTPEERQKQFSDLVRAFVQVVGGTDVVPDYTALEDFEVPTARATLAAIKALGFDIVNPPRWEAELEDNVAEKYAACFQTKDTECVTKWGPLQTKVVNDPSGLTEWLQSLLVTDNAAFQRLANAAVNTNVGDVAQKLIADAFNQAKTDRIDAAKAAVESGSPTAIDIQWMYAGQTVTVLVDEGFDLPQEVGGSRGVLDDNDVVTLTGQDGVARVVPANIAKVAIPSLTPATTTAVFSPLPALWDQQTEPYVPGQPLP